MPASLTRECPRCQQTKPIAAFRDAGDVTVGRPPKVCAACRAQDPALLARQAANVAYRPLARDHQGSYAARSEDQRLWAMQALHPDGTKTCPEVCGCGQVLPLSAFNANRWQADGLASACSACETEAALLHA